MGEVKQQETCDCYIFFKKGCFPQIFGNFIQCASIIYLFVCLFVCSLYLFIYIFSKVL